MNLRKAFLCAFNGIIFVLLILTLFSCNLFNSDDEISSKTDDPIPVPIEALENDTVRCRLQNIDFGAKVDELSGVELIIDNESDFDKYILCRCIIGDTIKINFDENFVLAGISTIQPTSVRVKEQNVMLISDTLKYKVIIEESIIGTLPGRAIYIVAISKKYSGYPVDFMIVKEDRL